MKSIAIVLMHAYAYPDHETAVAGLAREIGFEQISVSHEVSPLIKIVGRGDTTVADAYLSPILSRYVERVTTALSVEDGGSAPQVMFMASSGGLKAAELFQGRDAILSGPAGGIVGMAESAKMPASKMSSALTWAALRQTSRILRANTNVHSKPRLLASECACR